MKRHNMEQKRTIRVGTTRQQLAKLYNCDVDTIIIWLKEVGVNHQKNLQAIELAEFIASVGAPDVDVEIRVPYLKTLPLTT
ncbi:hypothetical protein OB69_02720 [Roseivirga seohaensis subsp. aquiponti]|uniref:Uncharacterized protein n=1 Tax=Roseivirga seohaensis subsp. aquiponti TaxID=1566026 RepID=A0A0L8ANY4_9BACT|nr:hypothetical protein [Roseivirga seohaensis]KOF03940.1 hypothetical protein OB69_02720 [Roseivirga seohaensis subsp. aquiponti]